ncbi:MAG: DUF1566 domain-containing protein, partial [Syntrophales bacterium]
DTAGNIEAVKEAVYVINPTNQTGAVHLPQTGQTSCYDANGAVISCTGTGHDGELQKGLAWPNPRFTDNGDQTVMDNLTGLIWTKDGNVMKTRDSGFDNDSTAGDGTVTWQRALDYIKKLNQETYLGHNDWRLPNIIELESLVNIGLLNSDIWLNLQGMSNAQSSSYWSSSTVAILPNYAWSVFLTTGFVNTGNKSINFYVWPVRHSGQFGLLGSSIISLPRTGQTTCYNASGSPIDCAGTGQDGELQMGAAWPNPRFMDYGDQTVMDNLTGLIWTKDGNAPGPAACSPGVAKLWQGALDYVKCLNTNYYLGHNDWRLPNRKELWSLVHVGQSNSNIFLNLQGLSNVQADEYWSSSAYPLKDYNGAWCVPFNYGGVSSGARPYSYYHVWPVRSGESGSFASLVILKSGSGAVTITPTGIVCSSATSECSMPFSIGTNVILTAKADAGEAFAGWSGGSCQGTSPCTVTLNASTTITATFTKEPPGKGDINYNGQVNLNDAVLALQVIVGILPQQMVYKEADVNGDGKIGLAEVIFILQKTAGMR